MQKVLGSESQNYRDRLLKGETINAEKESVKKMIYQN
jgi:hypothetical protein